ncbi:hypothetical protein [Consotaella aegiceratis]|uniref:hypothetical protein n=1 Tax=Consotaella aegiceratis TaxID=3097961 RepID=UPI002F3E20A8
MTEGMESAVREAVARAKSNGCIVAVLDLSTRIARRYGGGSEEIVNQVTHRIMEEARRSGVAMELSRSSYA